MHCKNLIITQSAINDDSFQSDDLQTLSFWKCTLRNFSDLKLPNLRQAFFYDSKIKGADLTFIQNVPDLIIYQGLKPFLKHIQASKCLESLLLKDFEDDLPEIHSLDPNQNRVIKLSALIHLTQSKKLNANCPAFKFVLSENSGLQFDQFVENLGFCHGKPSCGFLQCQTFIYEITGVMSPPRDH